ncbi:MAG: PD40 domain-containing protein [Chloroflexi bacterium]|nr:PD40 domain-containing protein [Chloroflexota bacterium]
MIRRWPGVLALALMLAAAGCAPAAPVGRSAAPPATGRLAYLAADDHVYTVALEGGDASRVDTIPGEHPVAGEMRISRWPTWTADGSRLAFMRLRSGEGSAPGTAAIWTVAPDGTDPRKIWESQEQAPIYMGWSPDRSMLAVLVQGRNEVLSLLLIDPGGSRPPRPAAEGGPLYFSWSPDAAQLLIHTGGDHRANPNAELLLLRPSASDERRRLGSNPAGFRTPAWSPNGAQLAFVAEAPDQGGVLTVTNASGGDALRLAPVSDEAAFIWSPDGRGLAFSSRLAGNQLLYQGLEVINADGTGRAQVTQEPVIAFFWSPDGKRLAFAQVDRQAQALAWFVTDAAGKNRKQVGTFLPSEEQLRHFAFFDQYAQSHALWSPDSRYLVYAGLAPESRGDPAAARGGRVFVVPADGSAEPRILVDGNLAIWPAPR